MRRFYISSILLALILGGCRSSILDDPTTSIRFVIEQPSHVKLTIENSYNTIVATLVDGDLVAGYHAAEWNATGQLEGIYFFTVEATGLNSSYYFKETRRLLLFK